MAFNHVALATRNLAATHRLELHDERCGDLDPGISSGLGLPAWVNHLAFDAADFDALARACDRLLEHGVDVMRMEHNHAVSVYAFDPNGTQVEWTHRTRPFTVEQRHEALHKS